MYKVPSMEAHKLTFQTTGHVQGNGPKITKESNYFQCEFSWRSYQTTKTHAQVMRVKVEHIPLLMKLVLPLFIYIYITSMNLIYFI